MTQEQLFLEWIKRQPINVGNLDYALKDEDSVAALMFLAFKAGRRMERQLSSIGKITLRTARETGENHGK